MRTPRAPKLEPRRAARFDAELEERARAWIPGWGLADGEHDFARALLKIAARFSSEVAERLDGAGEKMRRGFLDWLAVRGEAARPARMPVVFKLADTAREGVLAQAPVRMQADAGGTPVVFETETDVRLLPGNLDVVVAVDADNDAYFLPPPGLASLDPLTPAPTQWRLKSFAAAGATKVQLDPELGLFPDMIIEAGGKQYLVTHVDKDIVTIEPALSDGLNEQTTVARKVTTFAPFDGAANNRQEHALYLGHTDLLNIEAAATIEILGANTLREGVAWEYWGKRDPKRDPKEEVGWWPLPPVSEAKAQPNALVLEKPKGAIEPREIAGKSSRWIRAFKAYVAGSAPLLQVDALEIRVNYQPVPPSCPPVDPIQGASPAGEAMANTTPLVLDSVFFPLGKEPRQFDAFYLGSEEAFSKKGAQVQLCFVMADPTFAALSKVLGGLWGNLLAGVARDRALHLLQFDAASRALKKFRAREPLQPPLPGFNGNAASTNPVALDPQPRWQLPMWSEGFDFLVGTAAGADVWIWHEKFFDESNSGWVSFGQIPATVPPATRPVDGLVYLADAAAPRIAALREGKLFVRQWPDGPQWSAVDTEDAGNPVVLTSIVPIIEETAFGQLVTSAALGMVGVADDNTLYAVTLAGLCTPLSPVDVDVNVRPVAIQRNGGPLVIALVQQTLRDIVTFHSIDGETLLTLEPDAAVLGLNAVIDSGNLHFLAAVRLDSEDYLGSWMPPAAGVPIQLFRAPVPASVGQLGGTPTEVAQHVVIPGTRGDAFVAEFDLTRRFNADAVIEPGIVLPVSAPALVPNDVVSREVANARVRRRITDFGLTKEGEVFYPIDSAFPAGAGGPLIAHLTSTTPSIGVITPPTKFTLELNDRQTALNSWLLVDNDFRKVIAIDDAANPWVATVSPAFPGVGTGNYWRPLPTGGRTAPFMRLDLSNNAWDAALLQRVPLLFPGATPERQAAKAFSTDFANHPIVVALAAEFAVVPPGGPTFVVDAAASEWALLLGDTSSNPELSWEYWNGTGWWKLDLALDGTLHLKTTGAIRFEVPTDIAATDWAGKTNFWIRARLVGGNYGSEKVTVVTKDLGAGKTEQTVLRSTEGIKPPSVVNLHISYSLNDSVLPIFVLAKDSGSLRDQSDANRTAGAIVEAFVPLAVSLGRLARATALPETLENCPPECDCPTSQADGPSEPLPAEATPAATPPPATGRALFIGLSAALSEGPVNVLLLVEERLHSELAPMTIEALIADRFEPIVASDATRALGESGLLSMTFSIAPTPRGLFGDKPLSWLRLTPTMGGTEWKPAIRGAYLNAAWASATETLTRELVGSSEGAPNLTLFLARPPVLRDTLELRVKEPLGEEERKALLGKDPNLVLSAVENLPGDWVLWKRVIDPDDELPTERVYSLDEASGEIRFGDGRRGAIPPVGRDSIVAFEYKRTETGAAGSDSVPGNSIAPRASLNLVSPVESVEAVFAADQAAGGAPTEADERVVRFGTARLRHRNRAVTARDFEDLALQSSPDIVQARCFVRPDHVRLVVVMRGRNPEPNAAQLRELRRLLLAAAPASLAAPRALRITGPRVRRLRIVLQLRIASLDHTGDVALSVKQRMAALFDTATGGADKDGWALGKGPSDDDIALALVDTRRLEGLGDVTLREITPDGAEGQWAGAVKRDELVMLDEDPVRLEFRTVEVIA